MKINHHPRDCWGSVVKGRAGRGKVAKAGGVVLPQKKKPLPQANSDLMEKKD